MSELPDEYHDAKNSQTGWKRRKLISLLEKCGFIREEGGKHTKMYHPDTPADYQESVITIPRGSKELKPIYVKKAVRMIERTIKKGQE
ncbi:MAG: type II toxin-antitoxin system HicA family toxin [Anaerolineaceae bacterium]|nr:type II toxin-antitoxin system HicA family toxin [Anaerolineaceae bacterium]MCY4009267.1 type II toxin-antitoxin system HicA family toxin [Anaerolineaceae bacterium]MCY4106393.1 type II toxin-antitoxin system HicA family toxin [Chloroflexota bacterium]